MKYEFIYKVKPYRHATSYEVKYRCVVDPTRYEIQKRMYEKVQKNHPEEESVILINELDDLGNFIKVMQ